MPGRLNTRIVVERPVPGDDGYGNVVAGWSWLVTLWGDMREASGKEVVAAGREDAPRSAMVIIRRSAVTAGITEADRIVARGAVWNIRTIRAVGNEGALLELHCETGVAA